jgi:hypothetical protein
VLISSMGGSCLARSSTHRNVAHRDAGHQIRTPTPPWRAAPI